MLRFFENGWKIRGMASAAEKQNVYVCDAIGREKPLAAKGGRVKIVLSGSPIIVYGLKF